MKYVFERQGFDADNPRVHTHTHTHTHTVKGGEFEADRIVQQYIELQRSVDYLRR